MNYVNQISTFIDTSGGKLDCLHCEGLSLRAFVKKLNWKLTNFHARLADFLQNTSVSSLTGTTRQTQHYETLANGSLIRYFPSSSIVRPDSLTHVLFDAGDLSKENFAFFPSS